MTKKNSTGWQKVNICKRTERLVNMSRSKSSMDWWNTIFDNLILESDPPPTKYIKDAVIVTKNGAKFRISAEDFVAMIEQQKYIKFEDSDIYACSLNIDFTRIKRDVTRWANKFIEDIEIEAAKMVENEENLPKKQPKFK